MTNIDYDSIAQRGCQVLSYERASIERCKTVFPNAIVFDMGACDGLWSNACLQMGAKKVIAFERDDQKCAHLYKNHLSMFEKDRLQTVKCEIGPELKIDDWVRENNIYPDFIKMDIEGHEITALEGMKNILHYDISKKIKPWMMIEVHGGHEAKNIIVKMLQEFTGKEPSGENWILSHIFHLYYLPPGI